MAEYAVDSAFAYAGGLDLSDMMTGWNADGTFDVLDKTTMRNHSGTRARRFKGGLFNTDARVEGFTDLADDGPDEQMWATLQTRATRVVTAGNVETEGQPCVLLQSVTPQLLPHQGKIGELARFTLSLKGSSKYGPLRGPLLVKATSITTTGAKGTGVQAGAVGAAQNLFGSFHLLGAAGTTITAVLESDDNSNFTSATTRITFGPLTASGGTFATPVAGAIADDWWRIRVTAITGTWILAAAMAIE